MKKILIILALLIIASCEDVVEVDLEPSTPRLVIDASLNWVRGTSGSNQDILLSLTVPFFEESINPVTDAQVEVTSANGQTFQFIQGETAGTYETNTFQPELNMDYTIEVSYDGDTYRGTTTLVPVVPIDFVEQTMNGGLEGDDVELKPNYTDPADMENFYFYSFKADIAFFPSLEVYEDEFTNGNQVFAYYSEEDLEAGDDVLIRSFGITERFYDFMFILLSQTNSEVGGPFETQPATLRGNITNTTNPDNFPLGFFRASEVDEILFTVQ